MSSEDGLLALELAHNDEDFEFQVNEHISSRPSLQMRNAEGTITDLEQLSINEQLPPLVSAHTSDLSDDDMPQLMLVSDSSEEQDQLDDTSSEWEDDGDTDYGDGDGPPPFEHLPEDNTGATSEEGDILPSISRRPVSNPGHNMQAETSSLPPRQNPRPDEGLPDPMANLTNMRAMFDILHLGPTPGLDGSIQLGQFQREVLEHILVHGIAAQAEPRPSEPDPERAQVLVDALDTVPKGLLARMVQVGGAPGSHEDLSGDDEGPMAGCAVCWAPLLDNDLEVLRSGEQRPPTSSEGGEGPQIVSLPCAHVFHSACLLPWFSRPSTTTCPTCRFDIDPYSLTWKPQPQPRASSSMDGGSNVNDSQTPVDDWDDQTDVDVDDDEDMEDQDDDLQLSNSEIGFDDLFFNTIFATGGFLRPERYFRRHGVWTLPDAPDKTLRERIMEKERDMGLRCIDATCIFAPTDENPYPSAVKPSQISIKSMKGSSCKHTLHPACLVMSMRVTGRVPCTHEQELSVIEVSCPYCRTVGTMSKKDWDEGVEALALIC